MRAVLRIAAVNAAGILAVLVAAELIFGGWLSGPGYGILNIPRDVTRQFDTSGLYPGGGVVTYSRDRHGLRGRYPSPERIDVLVLGGSTTNELYIGDGETWVDRLGERFRAAGRPLVIVNAGVDGQTTVGHLRNFDAWFPLVPGLGARHVLAYVGINDVALGDAGETRYDAMASPDPWRRMGQYVRNHSVFYHWYRQARGVAMARDARVVHGAMPTRDAVWRPVADVPARADMARALGPALDAYRRRLRTLAERVRAFGAEPVFVTQAYGNFRVVDGRLFRLEPPDRSPAAAADFVALDLYNEATLAVCAELRLACADLARGIRFRDGDFYDSIHTTPAGSGHIAAYLYDVLKDVFR